MAVSSVQSPGYSALPYFNHSIAIPKRAAECRTRRSFDMPLHRPGLNKVPSTFQATRLNRSQMSRSRSTPTIVFVAGSSRPQLKTQAEPENKRPGKCLSHPHKTSSKESSRRTKESRPTRSTSHLSRACIHEAEKSRRSC